MASKDDAPDKIILVAGKTGSGKSSLCNKIADYKVFPVNYLLLGVADSIKSFTTDINYSGKRYKVQIIDTVGFFETQAANSGDKIKQIIQSEKNKQIIQNIRRYLRSNKILKLDVLFIVSAKYRLTNEEIQTIDALTNGFPELANNLVFVITHCEFFTNSKRTEIKEQFEKFAIPENIKRKLDLWPKPIKERILTVGLPDLDNNDEIDDNAKDTFKRKMISDVENIKEVIANSTSTDIQASLEDDSIWKQFLNALPCVIL